MTDSFSLVFLFVRFIHKCKFLSIYNKILCQTDDEATHGHKIVQTSCARTHARACTHTEWTSTAQLLSRRRCRSSQAIRRTRDRIRSKMAYVDIVYHIHVLVLEGRFKSNCGLYLFIEYCSSICTSLNRYIFLLFCYWKGIRTLCFIRRTACYFVGKENRFWVWKGIPVAVGKLVAISL
jgi:hypothetical protein